MLTTVLGEDSMANSAMKAAWTFGIPFWGRSRRTRVGALVVLLAAGAVAAGQVGHDPSLWLEARELGSSQPLQSGAAAPGDASDDECGWQPGFARPNLDGESLALEFFDDGTGPALYAGGWFATASGVLVNGIARWDGSAWSALSGPSGTGVSGTGFEGWVDALAVYDDGSGPALYAGGYFDYAGGVWVSGVARWDGSAWSPLSGPSWAGVDGWIYALAVYDDGSGPALYAGGYFDTAGGVLVNNIARWDGSAWSALSGPSGTGVNVEVYALAVYDDGSGPALFAGGYIGTAGGVLVNNVARWDGNGWSALGSPPGAGGYDDIVSGMGVFDDGSGPALYVGGSFTTAGGVAVVGIARWDGSAWSAIGGAPGTGVNGGLTRALASYDDGTGPALFAGGDFFTVGEGFASSYLAAWRCDGILFSDGFDRGDTNLWSVTLP